MGDVLLFLCLVSLGVPFAILYGLYGPTRGTPMRMVPRASFGPSFAMPISMPAPALPASTSHDPEAVFASERRMLIASASRVAALPHGGPIAAATVPAPHAPPPLPPPPLPPPPLPPAPVAHPRASVVAHPARVMGVVAAAPSRPVGRPKMPPPLPRARAGRGSEAPSLRDLAARAAAHDDFGEESRTDLGGHTFVDGGLTMVGDQTDPLVHLA